MAMHALRRYTNMGYREIGARFGRDHSTVIHEINLFESNLESDKELQKTYSKLKENM